MQYQPEHSPGEMIHGHYKIISFISRGGFGETYTVEDQRAKLTCLLKYLKPLNNSPTVLRLAEEKFVQEANILRRLGNHNQIPQLYDFFEENCRFYLVEEYIAGQNLADELRAGLFSETKVIEFLYDVLNVLDYLCQNNVIHRDIKPDNLIRRSHDNRIVLVDFGAVKELSTLVVNAQGQTILTMAIGTPGFMAPEQAVGRPDFASDIYALGITALFLLTRQIPANNQDNNSILDGLQLEPHFAKILEHMLRSKPEERYQTAADVIADLEPLVLLNQKLNQRYEIKSYLGGEGLSYTYIAEDNQRPYQAKCIIKRFKLQYNNQRLLQEAQNLFVTALDSLKKLSSNPQIPQVSNHFQINKELYLVYDFIQGETLSKEIKAGNRLSEVELIVFLKNVLEILSFTHKQGVIHGDIKPSNFIKKQQDGKFCLIDFAEFKQITNLKMNSQNISVSPGGTDGYRPPEQYQNQLQDSSDIYALGITAIQALTGVPPEQLQKDSQNEVIWQDHTKTSPKLARILDKMVRFQAGKRYQSAQRVLDDLNAKTWRDKLEKHRATLIIISIFLGISTVFLTYDYIQNYELVKLDEAGIGKMKDGDRYKTAGDTSKADDAYGKAIQNFNELTKRDPSNPNFITVYLNLSHTYLQLSNPENRNSNIRDSTFACGKAKEINPSNPYVWLCFGNTSHASKKYPEAIEDFEKIINLVSTSRDDKYIDLCALALINKGNSLLAWHDELKKEGKLLLASQKLSEAEKAYDQAIEKKSSYHPAALVGKADVLLKMKKYEDALNYYVKALDIQNDYKQAKDGIKKAKEMQNLLNKIP